MQKQTRLGPCSPGLQWARVRFWACLQLFLSGQLRVPYQLTGPQQKICLEGAITLSRAPNDPGRRTQQRADPQNLPERVGPSIAGRHSTSGPSPRAGRQWSPQLVQDVARCRKVPLGFSIRAHSRALPSCVPKQPLRLAAAGAGRRVHREDLLFLQDLHLPS